MSEKAENVTVETLLSEQDWLRALARRLVRDDSCADDLLQDVFVRVISGPPRTVRSVRAWLTRVLVNRHRDVRQSEDARADREERATPRRVIPSAADLAARVDAQRQVAAALVSLDEPLRETVLLRFYEDLSVRAIGRRMGVPYETARARLKRGLDQLRSRLAPEEEGGARRWSTAFLALAGQGRTGPATAAATATATATLTGVVIVMKQKLVIAAAVLVLLAAGMGGVMGIYHDATAPTPEPVPEEIATLPREPVAPAGVPGDSDSINVTPQAEQPDEEAIDPDRGTCHGRITNADGTPASGLTVRLSGRPAKVVETDAEGRFRIENEWVDPLGRTLYLGPLTGSLAVGQVPLRAGADVEFDAVIPAGCPLAIEVVSAVDGRPLEGVWVIFEPLDEPRYPRAFCISDVQGRGGLTTVPLRSYRVHIASQGFQPFTRHLDLTDGGVPEVLRIELEDPEEFRLRITPPPPGKDLTGSLAFLPDPEDPIQGQHQVFLEFDENGTAVGIAPPPGRYRVHVDVYGVLRRMVEDVVVREREPVEITLFRAVGVEVRGVLLSADGKPCQGTVTLHPKLPPPNGTERQARTDERGEFTIAEFPPCHCWVEVRVGRFTLHQVLDDVEVTEGGLPDLRVQLPVGGSLSGRITGSPLPNAHFVSLYQRAGERWKPIASLAPDRHGRFQAESLPPGRTFILAGPHRAEQGWARLVEVEIREGEDAGAVEIPWLESPAVKLVVTGQDGAAVQGNVTVSGMRLRSGGDLPAGGLLRSAQATLDESGRAVIRSLIPGRMLIQVTLDNDPSRTTSAEVEVREVGNDTIRITLPD